MKSKFVLFIIVALVAGMTLAGPAVRSLRSVITGTSVTTNSTTLGKSPTLSLPTAPFSFTLPPTTQPPTTQPPTTEPPTTQPPTQAPDTDGDGITDAEELVADTDPTNKNSALRILGLVNDMNGLRIDWQGGSAVTQFLERSFDLWEDPIVWTPVYTNLPPTPISTNILDTDTTNGQAYYRLRVVR